MIILIIEAEALPDEQSADSEMNESVSEEKKKTEPLSFLNEAEQEKVWKLVSQYQKIGEAEVSV